MEFVHANSQAQADALLAIIGERNHQDVKWGTVEDRPKQVGSWLTLMRKLLRDAEDAWATSSDDILALDEMRKVVAVGVACFEQHGAPLRDVPVVVPAPIWQPPAKDGRLASISNERLHKGFDAIRYTSAAGYDFDVDGQTLTLTREQIETELEARNDSPIPF